LQKRPDPDEIIQLIAPLLTGKRRRRIDEILEKRTRYVTLVLDDLYHQHNMSAVVRSCEAFGIQDLHVIELENRFLPAHGVSMGAEQWVSIIRHTSIDACLNSLRNHGYRIFAADPPERASETRTKQSIPIDQVELEKGPVAILLGKELDGLDPRLRNGCDAVVYIPLRGFTESLNVSVTAALFLFQLRKRLDEMPATKWRLYEDEIIRLKADWYVKSLKRGKLILKDLLERKGDMKIKRAG